MINNDRLKSYDALRFYVNLCKILDIDNDFFTDEEITEFEKKLEHYDKSPVTYNHQKVILTEFKENYKFLIDKKIQDELENSLSELRNGVKELKNLYICTEFIKSKSSVECVRSGLPTTNNVTTVDLTVYNNVVNIYNKFTNYTLKTIEEIIKNYKTNRDKIINETSILIENIVKKYPNFTDTKASKMIKFGLTLDQIKSIQKEIVDEIDQYIYEIDYKNNYDLNSKINAEYQEIKNFLEKIGTQQAAVDLYQLI